MFFTNTVQYMEKLLSSHNAYTLTVMFPSANSQQRLSASGATGGKSKKVPLPPGHSLVDWIRLTKSGVDLKGTGPRLLRIPEEELAKHAKADDLWIALRGMVYNVTKYVDYHPGGAEELLRGAGKDATSLFDEVHRWVNYESMLKECLIGKLITTTIPEKPTTSSASLTLHKPDASNLDPIGVNKLTLGLTEGEDSNVPSITIQDFSAQSTIPSNSDNMQPRYDWYQNDEFVFIILYCKSSLSKNDLQCDIEDKRVVLDIILKTTGTVYSYKFDLFESISRSIDLMLTKSGKAQLTLKKSAIGQRWPSLGDVETSNSPLFVQNMSNVRFCECTIIGKVPLTHDTSLYEIAYPQSRWMAVPIGYHVYIKVMFEGMEVLRPYTPVVSSIFNPHCISHENLFLAIKHYQEGLVTGTLRPLVEGDKLSLSTYDGDFDIDRCLNLKCCVMLAAGTGITPMIKVMHFLLHDTNYCILHLLFFNKSQRDIIWHSEFAELQKLFPSKLFVLHILSQPCETWSGPCGRISDKLVNDYVHEHSIGLEDGGTKFLICGPTEFCKLSHRILDQLNISNVHVFK